MNRKEFRQLIKEELIKEAKGTSYEAKLAEIEKQGKITTLEAKIDALAEMIEAKTSRLSLVSEDENLAELIDKKKIKEMQKEIKLLEKQKAKMEKLYEKMNGGKKKKEIVDEEKEVEEGYNSSYEEDDVKEMSDPVMRHDMEGDTDPEERETEYMRDDMNEEVDRFKKLAGLN